LTGFEWEASSRGVRVESFGEILAQPSLLLLGLPYSLSLLAILGTHEMGHYIACRRYGIDSTPPYFLPSPPGMLFGTFGAFIRIRAPITDRRALFDIGVAGPLAGAVVAVPVLIAGILGSRWIPDPGALEGSTAYIFGNSMIISAAESIFAAPPPPGEGYVLAHSSMIFAGWVGLLATALNLLPVGQLDGGHIAYSLSMRFHRYLSRLCLAGFVVLGLTVNEAWLFWATLIIFFSPGHPRLVEERTVLTRARRLVAILAGIILIACFVPSPIRIVG
jgi:membrane-associated protease RseP (regulator of RpoE activity)